MKTIFTHLLFLLPSFLWAQTIDSTVIKQVDSLIQVSRDLTGQQEFDKALQVNAAAEKLALEKLGRESAAYGSCCFNRGRVLYFKTDHPEAEIWYLESKTIREKVLGKEHPDYANSLNNLALLYMEMGQYEKSEPLYLEAKAIREKALGKEHPMYAASLGNIGVLYNYMGQYDKAEPLYLESIAIKEKVLGKEHPDYAGSLNNLALLYMEMGQYEKSEPLYLEAKAIREKVLGKEHPDYAASLNSLGIMYNRMGQYEKAEKLYIESKAIWKKVLGKEHPDYARSLSNLAILYYYLGQYEKAEALHLESIAIIEKVLGKEHPDYAVSLSILAVLYWNIGQYGKAEAIYLESKNIVGRVKGKENPSYCGLLINLAILYKDMRLYEKAEPLLLEAKQIFEIHLNNHIHPFYLNCLNNLALLYSEIGQNEKAELLMLEAKTIREKVLGKEHPDYVQSLHNLALLYWDIDQYEKTELIFLELSTVNKFLIEKGLLHLSERELNIYLNQFSESQHRILSFTHLAGGEMLIEACFNNSLFYKGFLLNAANQVKRLALSDSTSTEKFYSLKGYQRRLATQYALPIAERDSAEVAELETKANDLEKDLTRTVAGFGEAQRQVKWSEVQQALQPGEAAIEFVHYRFYEKKQTDSTMYAALLLLPGNAPPKFISLFEENSLDSLLQTLGERKFDYVNNLYTIADRGARPLGQPQKSIYELLWQPMENELEGIQTVYFSPSGLLHRLNLGAVPIPPSLGGGQGEAEETLADRFRLVELGSTRQLVAPTDMETVAQDAVLYGGVQFEMDSTAITAANLDYHTETFASRGELSFSASDSTSRGGSWNYLTWTDKEISTLEPILKNAGIETNSRKGYAATEESFKAIGQGSPSPRFLHIATHGFFFPDPENEKDERSESVRGEPVFKMSDHPMIRSGLIMAGGNYAWKTGKPLKPDMDDGILTAYEISQMNLSNTELVVLSACETGLGDIKGNEGVYGLQRAFKIAGAKYLIMSLWQVPDKETAFFMELFYKKLLEDKMAIPEAFRATQDELRKNPFVTPYQWAGFVLVE